MSQDSRVGGSPPGSGSSLGNAPVGRRNEGHLGRASPFIIGTPPGFSILGESQQASSSGVSIAETVSTPSIASTEVSSITTDHQTRHFKVDRVGREPSQCASRLPPGFSIQQGAPVNVKISESASVMSASTTESSSTTSKQLSTERSMLSNAVTQSHVPNSTPQELHGLQPKAILAGWFGKTYRQLISKKDFHSWHDGGMPHQLKFTAVFVSPITGEIFPCGRYGDCRNYCVRRDPRTNVDVIWYTKKTYAEHAAAAKAYDCFVSRLPDRSNNMMPRIALEMPYKDPQSAPPLPTLPQSTQIKITDLHNTLLRQTKPKVRPETAQAQHATQNEFEGESRRYREEYRATRGGPFPKDPRMKRC